MNIVILILGIILVIAPIVILVVMSELDGKKNSQPYSSNYGYSSYNKIDKKKENKSEEETQLTERPKHGIKNAIVILSIMFGFVLIVLSQSFVIIPTGYTGVKICFGQIASKTVGTGLSFKRPFIEEIEQVNNKQQDISFKDEIWSETMDRTALFYKNVTVTYQINPEKSSWIYANITNYEDNLLSIDLISSAVKSSSKTLKDVDATNRAIVEPLIAKEIEKAVKTKYGSDVVYIRKVSVNNIDFEESYNKAIADKQKAQINAEKQQIENQKKIDKAKAEAEATKEKAKAEAEATKIKAEAEAEANELRKKSLSNEILRNYAIEKWDGTLPKASGQDLNLILDLFGSENNKESSKK